jgi:hypothetical protein
MTFDLTEARPVVETVTADEIVAAARRAEREAVCQFLMAQAFQVDPSAQDTVLVLRDVIKAGGHL